MKRYFKKSLYIFIFIFSIFVLISCAKKSDTTIDDTTPESSTDEIIPTPDNDPDEDIIVVESWKSGETIEGKKIEYDLTDEELDQFFNNLNLAKDICVLDDSSRYDEFISIYNTTKNMKDRLIDASRKEDLLFYIYGNLVNYDKTLHFNGLISEISSWVNTIQHLIYENNGYYKTRFYENMTDDAIKDLIGEKYPQEYYQMKNELSRLENLYNTLDESSNSYYEDVDNIFVQYVNLGNEFVDIYYDKYDNYFEYLYAEEYHRDYKPEDASKFFENVINYVLPIYKSYNNEYRYYYNLLDDSEKKLINSILYGDGFTECFDLIEDYKEFIGGDFKETFDNLFTEGGPYYITYEEEGDTGAHMWTLGYGGEKVYPYVFYGTGRHNPLTIMHEFGHYFNEYINIDDNSIMDLLETHSQANEFLFSQYLCQYKFENENIGKALNNYMIYDYAEYLVFIGMVNEVERMCYEKDTLELGDLHKISDEIYDKYPDFEYFGPSKTILYKYSQSSTMSSPGYYISYATSQLGALNLNRIAEDDYDKAIDTYYKLIYRGENNDFIDVYEYAGLLNPFEESTFEYIFGLTFKI